MFQLYQVSYGVHIQNFFSPSTESRFVVQWNMDANSLSENLWLPISSQRLQYKVIRKAMRYCISIPINVMLVEAKEFNLNIRFNLIASKFIYKAMANKFSIAYSSLEEMEITVIRKNRQVKARKRILNVSNISLLVGMKSTSFTYPLAYWHSYEIFSLKIKYIKVIIVAKMVILM